MSLQLTDAKRKALIALIKNHHEQHLARFPFAKYPIEPLDVWKRQFSDPANVDSNTLRSALSWSCGKWQQQSILYSYKKLHLAVVSHWKGFVEQIEPEPIRIINYWTDLLGSGEHAFNTVAFLAHLLCPEQVELADSRRIKGMNDLFMEVELSDECTDFEKISTAVDQYTQFYRLLLPKMQPILGDKTPLKLSRFLYVYGYREVLKTSSLEPTVSSLDWEKVDSSRFNIHLISEKANADILFACLLLTLETKKENTDKLTVQDIVGLIPLGSGGICNAGSYNYALISMFGRQKNRDYFHFDDPGIVDIFTQQANQSTRDMRFYDSYADHIVTINPKYIKNNNKL
ncbi:hypothetical protein PUW24_07170 [Paenibacillus urinalis]|uniref:Uncharacterized protein n=1 Tax=Paenibacillus urinalis TaxID=521520 RepID=A0ABY7XC12_9BACL|nr:hypothetical protein [Paenibacillus urinalis]WDH98691.1 hypothetical protein PUW24_07170 [Paenibacillus urinalis]WDI02384.1 hypothetical protein PUW25_24890 [Paenibacillus urinalis]